MRGRSIPGRCAACGSLKKMPRDEIAELLAHLPDWSLSDADDRISSEFEFADFMKAMEFVNRLAEIAEREQHHPELQVFRYRHVRVGFRTFSSGGVTMNDLTMAKLTERLYAEMSGAGSLPSQGRQL